MKKSLFFVLTAILVLMAARGGQPVAASPAEPARPGTDQLIVWFAPPAGPAGAGESMQPAAFDSQAAQLALQAAPGLRYVRELGQDGHVLKLDETLPSGEVLALAARLAQEPGISRVEPDWMMQPATVGTPDDEFWYTLWALEPYASSAGVVANAGIDMQAAWQITTGDPNLVIAVIDTGIMAHEDLSGRYVGGYDMIYSAEVANDNDGDLRDPDPSDMGDDCSNFQSSSWHGTHVAGTIAAAANNGIGVTGINWQSTILPVRVLGCGGGYTSDITDAIRWSVGLSVPDAVDNPPANRAKIINLSLGGRYTCPRSMQDAIDAARALGAVVVAAAGNNAVDAATFAPASCMGVITVGASNRSGKQARYSNYGNLLELSAPGGEIVAVSQGNDFTGGIASTVGFGSSYPPESWYAYYEGTSMAAPHVSGVLSLMYSINPQLTADLAAQILQGTASPFSVEAPCSQCGSGILHAGRAVAAADSLRVLQAPSPYAWAFAGDAAAPNTITVVTRQKLLSTPTTVTIGDVEASVVSVLTQNGRDYLTVQPSVLLANGFYRLSATVDGVTYTHEKAVLFGKQLYLPAVRR